MIPDLKERVAAQRAELDRLAMMREAWDMRICPHCGSTDIKETSFHELSGQSTYKCNSCGAVGEGEMAL